MFFKIQNIKFHQTLSVAFTVKLNFTVSPVLWKNHSVGKAVHLNKNYGSTIAVV